MHLAVVSLEPKRELGTGCY